MLSWITPELLVSVLAVVVAAFAMWYARRGANEVRRANDLLEQQLQRQHQREAEQARRDSVRWTIERSGGEHAYRLHNVGNETAREVTARASKETTPYFRDLPDSEAIEAGAVHPFRYSRRLGAPSMPESLSVSWEGADGPVMVALPPRPPKPPKPPPPRRDRRRR